MRRTCGRTLASAREPHPIRIPTRDLHHAVVHKERKNNRVVRVTRRVVLSDPADGLIKDLRTGRLGPDRKERRREIHDLAVGCIESFRKEHRRGWGHDLVLWALSIGGRIEPPPPTPGRYLLHVLATEFPQAVKDYKRFYAKVGEGTMPEPTFTNGWLRDPWAEGP